MKISVSWLGVFLIVFVIIYFGIYGKHVYETFQDKPIEPFVNKDVFTSDIKITTCPAESKSYIDTKGYTMCCDGVIEGDACSGRNMCTLSESRASIPTCSEWYYTYLEEKGKLKCPPSLPNYYEDPNGDSGCTSGLRNAEGTNVLTLGEPYCNIYKDQAKDESEVDSCDNKKLLDTSVCFTTPTVSSTKALVYHGYGNPATVQCTYTDSEGTPYSCTTDKSMMRLVSYNLPAGQTLAEWKATSPSWDPLYKLQFCSALEQYKITNKVQPSWHASLKTWCFPQIQFSFS